MSNNYYKIYVDSVIKLAQTLVIKSTDTVDLQNKLIVQLYGSDAVDPFAPETWKYYMNLAGEYHFTDQEMYIVSLDTLETILFSKENLRIHRATARAYAFGERNYRELLTLYPKQESLIYGIISPVDKQTAIEAEDGDILAWPNELVEPNEYSLISKLETWIKSYKLRWENRQFGISDDLYFATSHAVMYLMLVPAILNFRLEACKTNEAHSYHVREYLASHNGLDHYLDFLTLKQSLFLYRNIRYIQRNAGSQEMFDLLVDKLMTARLMPIGEYTARHMLQDMPDSLVPTVKFRKKPLNLGMNSTAYDLLPIEDFYAKERTLARDNRIYEQEYMDKARQDFSYSTSNVVLTKAIESTVVDYADSSPYKLSETLVSNWLHQSNIGVYQAVVSCTNPKTGERYSLRANEACVFMQYLYYRAANITLTHRQPMLARRVIRDQFITTDDMLKVVSAKWRNYLRPYLDAARNMLPLMSKVISIDAFYRQTYEIYTAVNKQRFIIAQEQHQEIRAQFANAVAVLFTDRVYYPENPDETFATWLADRNIFIDELSRDQYELMYLELLREGTGLSVNTHTSIRDVQQALLKLMTALSSYSIQFMSTMNAASITSLDYAAQRVGDDSTTGSSHYEVTSHGMDIVDRNDIIKVNYKLDTDKDASEPMVDLTLLDYHYIDMQPNLNPGSGRLTQYFSVPTGLDARVALNPIPYENALPNALGMDYFLQLSQDQRFAFKDFWVNVMA